ncbi:hypothetical protein [Rhodococcus sp. ARC_M6]|nr:hypothetical protein [Rhodococcus sp. ARC_M6]
MAIRLFSCGVGDHRRLPFRLPPNVFTVALFELVCETLGMSVAA